VKISNERAVEIEQFWHRYPAGHFSYRALCGELLEDRRELLAEIEFLRTLPVVCRCTVASLRNEPGRTAADGYGHFCCAVQQAIIEHARPGDDLPRRAEFLVSLAAAMLCGPAGLDGAAAENAGECGFQELVRRVHSLAQRAPRKEVATDEHG
jgi:hypothetical protein